MRIEQEVYEKLNSLSFKEKGFNLIYDSDGNLSFEHENEIKIERISIPYSKSDGSFLSAGAGIVFKELQKAWSKLCSESITGKLGCELEGEELIENENRVSIVLGSQIRTPEGVLESKFSGYRLEDFSKKSSDKISLQNSQEYDEYLELFYSKAAHPFFTQLGSIKALDELTNDLDIYSESLYLTDISPLKKIIIMSLTGNQRRQRYIEEYKARLEPHKNTPAVATILASVDKIITYFGDQPV